MARQFAGYIRRTPVIPDTGVASIEHCRDCPPALIIRLTGPEPTCTLQKVVSYPEVLGHTLQVSFPVAAQFEEALKA
jgi:hypothetical protein